jgi:Cu(I)/Ag(I) efflux system membrane fusion protein
MYVTTGTLIYRIADLSHVWVKLDAYESDLPWLRYGQSVEFTTESQPGEVFSGRISFIDPVLTTATRTVKLRVNVDNADGMLKPGMFVKAVVRTSVSKSGTVIDEALVDKWISPMHPEIIKDGPGDCDVCGMALVKAGDLGFVRRGGDAEPPVVIPVTAPLITGKRAVVYVQHPKDPSRFEGRPVVLGVRADDYYVVTSGLEEGEKVVVNGNFKLDSALQIVAKPSMMSAHDSDRKKEMRPFDVAPKVAAGLSTVFTQYLALQTALAADKPGASKSSADSLLKALDSVPMTDLNGDAHVAWMNVLPGLKKAASRMGTAPDIDHQREQFEHLSNGMIRVAQQFGTGLKSDITLVHCPMAFDNVGADWLQADQRIANPYFGASMLRCGAIKATLPGGGQNTVPPKHNPHKHHDH